ncbi:MAG: DUF4395 family protein [Capsulimonadaceae bacterium]|nr:DUF4395 family protein [Capsulimonadaceae bacterium]
MTRHNHVPIHKQSFAFCRYSLAALTWLALAFHSTQLVVAAGVIMLLSALLRVGRAPLIVLWDVTFEKLRPSPIEMLDENAMRFAHFFGFALFALDGLLLSFHATALAGWIFLGLIGIAKTAGALGFCAASKMYTCAANSSGSCCSFWRRLR